MIERACDVTFRDYRGAIRANLAVARMLLTRQLFIAAPFPVPEPHRTTFSETRNNIKNGGNDGTMRCYDLQQLQSKSEGQYFWFP